jgi:hypothetical protein
MSNSKVCMTISLESTSMMVICRQGASGLWVLFFFIVVVL